MTALIVLLWMMIGAVAGLAIGDAVAPAFGFRNMEGMSVYFGETRGDRHDDAMVSNRSHRRR